MEGKRDFEGISQSCTEVFDYKYVLEIRLALRLYFDWIFFEVHREILLLSNATPFRLALIFFIYVLTSRP